MFLAVDIGNTLTKFGLFDGDELKSKFSVETETDDLVGAIDGRLDDGFDSAAVCSVVPESGERLERLLNHGFGVEPIWIDRDTDLGLEVLHTPRETLGTDRLVNCFAAAEKYGVPVIVCSLGTATTINFVNANRELVGGLIAPGMQLMANALHESTAQLPKIDAEATDQILGATTEDAIRSGVFVSVAGLLDRAIDTIHAEHGDATVVATGGLAKVFEPVTNRLDVIDQELTLEGLRLIARRLTARVA